MEGRWGDFVEMRGGRFTVIAFWEMASERASSALDGFHTKPQAMGGSWRVTLDKKLCIYRAHPQRASPEISFEKALIVCAHQDRYWLLVVGALRTVMSYLSNSGGLVGRGPDYLFFPIKKNI
jgi:hypothetical protein